MAYPFLSRSLTWGSVLAVMDLLLMAAVANDGSVSGSSTVGSTLTVSGGVSSKNVSVPVDTTPSGSSASPPSPSPFLLGLSSFASLVRDNGSEAGDIKGSVLAGGNWTGGTTMDAHEPPPENSSFLSGNRTLTAQVNSNALIPCLVKSSPEGVTVSWIRRETRNYHLLTVGLGTYSSDNRFQVIHAQSPEDWTLKIRFVQPRDAGVYECSISTHPPSSIFATLNVIEARAEIAGGPDKYIKSGSTLRLICDFKLSTEQPEYVFWYHGLRMINYDPSRSIEVRHERYSSTLLLNNVQKTDSGNYTCNPSNASPASIFVHIINGENPAAMQHGSHSTTCVPCPPLWFLSILLSLALQHLYFRFLNDCHHTRSNPFPTKTLHYSPFSYLQRTTPSRNDYTRKITEVLLSSIDDTSGISGKYRVEGTLVTPGVYRIIGAEGDASLTPGENPLSELAKVSMTFWNGTTTPAQEWVVTTEITQPSTLFSLVNSAVPQNVLSLVEPFGSLRLWKIMSDENGVTQQIKDAETGQCLTRLGVAVYDEGSPCDDQAQSQKWKLLFIRNFRNI